MSHLRQYSASPECAVHVPYDGFAGTGRAAFPTKAWLGTLSFELAITCHQQATNNYFYK
jgi:hypothetical protein